MPAIKQVEWNGTGIEGCGDGQVISDSLSLSWKKYRIILSCVFQNILLPGSITMVMWKRRTIFIVLI